MTISNRYQGFTLIELVMVIVVLGILSSAILPKFFDTTVFQERAFYDDVLAAVRYAQKLAVASNCSVQLTVTGNQYSLQRTADRTNCQTIVTADFTQDVLQPAAGAAYTGSQTGVTLNSGATNRLVFLPSGAASANLTINVGSSRVIKVYQTTGFVHAYTP